ARQAHGAQGKAREPSAATFWARDGDALGQDRRGHRYADAGGAARLRGLESARRHAASQSLARRGAGPQPVAACLGPPLAPALYRASQYPAADLRALCLEARRSARELSPLSRQSAAPELRSARRADPHDAAQGKEPLRYEGRVNGSPGAVWRRRAIVIPWTARNSVSDSRSAGSRIRGS